MYGIYFADMARATGRKEIKKRPVVVIKDLGDRVKVLKITSRNRNDSYHVHMNNFLIHGFCDVSCAYTIQKKFLLDMVRSCTVSEREAIEEKVKYTFLRRGN